MSTVVLISTIPARRSSCERLLGELTRQSRVPDGVVLVLDGYGENPTPVCPLPIVLEKRTNKPLGAGQRWLAAAELPVDDIVVCLDDDIMLFKAPQLVQNLADAVTQGGAAAAMGRDSLGKQAPPSTVSRGNLIYAAGCGLAMKAGELATLGAFATEMTAGGGPDALGLLGDDDALVSAYLWKRGVTIQHTAIGNIFPAPNTRSSSQTAARTKRREDPDAQKRAIARVTGWPWPGEFQHRRSQQGKAIRAAR